MLQKRIITLIVGIRGRDSCREHFKKLRILPLQSQYIISLLLFVVDNGIYYRMNSEIHSINTRNKSNLHPPISNLPVYQKAPYYSGIRVFNNLPSQIKDMSHTGNKFKCALKNFFYFYSFLLWMNILTTMGFKFLLLFYHYFMFYEFYLTIVDILTFCRPATYKDMIANPNIADQSRLSTFSYMMSYTCVCQLV
jgi:hypothetical protein